MCGGVKMATCARVELGSEVLSLNPHNPTFFYSINTFSPGQQKKGLLSTTTEPAAHHAVVAQIYGHHGSP